MIDTIYRVKKLPEIIKKKGRTFRLILRDKKVAIFQVQNEGILMGYEVGKIGVKDCKKVIENIEWMTKKKYKGDLLNFDKVEVYPPGNNPQNDSSFHLPEHMKNAMKRFNLLVEKSK